MSASHGKIPGPQTLNPETPNPSPKIQTRKPSEAVRLGSLSPGGRNAERTRLDLQRQHCELLAALRVKSPLVLQVPLAWVCGLGFGAYNYRVVETRLQVWGFRRCGYTCRNR